MVEHLVWFKLKEGTPEAQRQAMLAALRALPAQIEGIENLACGTDFSGRSHGFEIGLVVRLVSRAALEAYAVHPAHEAFLARFRPLFQEVRALDFEA